MTVSAATNCGIMLMIIIDNTSYGYDTFCTGREYWRGKYHCTVDLLFDWFGISCMTTDNFCFYLQNWLIQTSQTGGQWYSDTYPLVFPGTVIIHDDRNIFIVRATGFGLPVWLGIGRWRYGIQPNVTITILAFSIPVLIWKTLKLLQLCRTVLSRMTLRRVRSV